MLIAGRYAMTNSPFLQGWQQEYMKANGTMPSMDKVQKFLLEVVNNPMIAPEHKQAEINMLNQMQLGMNKAGQ